MKIKGRLWFDWKNGCFICEDLEYTERGELEPTWNFPGDTIADFCCVLGIKSGQSFEIELKGLDIDETKTYWDGRFDNVKQ